MLNRKTALVVSLLAVSTVAAGLLRGYIGYISEQLAHPVSITYPASPHPKISIGRDSDFITVGAESGCRCVTSGSGSERDPYIIAG